MRSEDIKTRVWTEKERQALRLAAKLQAAESDTTINFDEIPRLTEKQLASMIRLRNVKRKVT